MSDKTCPIQDEIDRCFSLVEARLAALEPLSAPQLPKDAAAALLALAEAALRQDSADVRQTVRSIVSFQDGLRDRRLEEQDRKQLRLLLDNLRRELQRQGGPVVAVPALVTAIAPTARHDNGRVALYIESRAIAAMLHEVLEQAGFAPRTLSSMQELAQLEEQNCPAAVIADLSLCRRDADTLPIMTGLRARFAPPPHLFALAGADDIEARLCAVRLGATRFLKKPIDTTRLIAILQGVTARTRTENFRALFVDDDRSMTAVYAAAMQQAAIEAHVVNNPLEAPALIAELAPDVIVTDVYMPGCNGFELAALLRQDESLADTPILFLSSETDIHRQMEALDLGADDFLTKPVNMDVLQAAVIARAKRARMLKRSRREYRRVVEHLKSIELAIDEHSIVSIGDVEGKIIYVNRRFCEISGYSADELLGVNHRIVKSGLHPPGFYQVLWETISRGRSWHGEICNRSKDGGYYWVEATITPQLDDQGRVARYISVRTDITPLKEMQAQLLVAKAEAEAASQAKSVFLAHMSHELKTPLNSIIGFSQLMQDDPAEPVSTDQQEMLGAIERGGRHLLELINDLVDLAKIETGHMGLDMETLELAPVVRECLALLKPQAQRRGIALVFDEPDEAGRVYADRMRVKQVLLNLVSNAIKYNREQGRVTIGYCRRDGICQLQVRDTGPGIAPQDQTALFQPFSRLRGTAQQVEGTGIGLALSKNLIERMGGRIGVFSQPGEGSEFWFSLPAVGE
ncbi:MAG: response regulator [Methylococcaceae bacterium]|nr:MAG: response regulator [Methylococcaceae bacterium]